MEGRRSLGLEILGMVEEAMPEPSQSQQPLAALRLAIAEDINPKENEDDGSDYQRR